MLAASVQNGFHAATTASRSCLLTGTKTLTNHPFLIAAALIFCLSFARIVYLKYFHPLARFRGPFLAPISNGFWYYTILSGRGPWRNHSWHQKWGPIVRIAPNHLSFSSYAANKVIYGFGTRTVPSMVKDPIFFTPEVDHSMNIINETDREEHSRMRRMLSFAFSNSNLLENEDVLIRRTDDFLKTLADVNKLASRGGKRGFNIVQQFNYVTFNIMGEMSFGDSWDKRLEEQPEHRYHWADVIVNTTYMNDVMRAVCVIPGLFSFLEWYKTDHMKKTLYRHAEYATEHTTARLKLQTDRKDFVHHILTSKGPRPTELEMGSHFNVIMMAGAVTTATFLAGVTYYLGRNRAALARLQHEVRSRFGSLDEINSKALMECEYLNAVMEEGLRIYPPAGAGHLSRIVPKGGCEIEGEWIPEGTRVSVHQWSVLRDPLNFWNPSEFIPERWMKNEPEGQNGDRLETSLPFAYGPRGCLGRNLAYLEMRMVLAKLFWQYDLAWFNSDEVDWERDTKGYTLWEKPDLRVLLRDRLASDPSSPRPLKI
ncbi:related to isotrichodermin C-15 hydroxylase (cytochrome P-450 monooxygenase CYP65A1) [Phialocephala subalpina]|uniref:Related to isotrichodermin C-15 hydroxylase (Cytochrome P-450 monooxygenase CYP65A1) n=1 Tax=Phialocephala subalpina TaxID=576137 RepID=A0A1L7XDE2_9HELO|nr:related to isotrichodermin C-15 hydroxylase (cytochrome P-450 monooxygenase CYP65A1) [Phialocephala subalpina]